MAQQLPRKIGQLDEFPPMNYVENDSFPMDIHSSKFMSISLPPLKWLHIDTMPSKVNIRNSGYLLNVEPEYSGQVPALSGSAFECPYAFWCFHLHWGPDNVNGSEHRIDGTRLPTEIHLLFYNARYSNTDEALKADDGILVLVYMCKLTDQTNATLESLSSNLEKISEPNKFTFVEAFPLSSLFDSDLTDYLLYWREHGVDNEKHTPWIISQKPVWINESQLSRMRSLRGSRSANITSNSQCQKRYRRSEHVFAVTTDDSRAAAAAEPGRPGHAVDGLREPLAGTAAPDPYDLEGGRAGDTGNGGHELIADSLHSVKRLYAAKSIEMMIQGQTVEDDLSEFKTEIEEHRKVQKTHREGVRMNETAIRRENHIKNKLQKNADLKK